MQLHQGKVFRGCSSAGMRLDFHQLDCSLAGRPDVPPFWKELFSIRPGIPIILCTGFNDSITGEKAKKMGIRKFVMKPLVMSELAEAVREVLDA